MGGYDFIRIIHRKFGILISAGLIYSNLYRLERKGFIRGYSAQKSRVYKISDEGKQFMRSAQRATGAIKKWIERIMKR